MVKAVASDQWSVKARGSGNAGRMEGRKRRKREDGKVGG